MRILTTLVFILTCLLCSGSDHYAGFQPDLSTSDPYLPYLRRIPLSGVWDGSVCFSGNKEELRAFEQNKKRKTQKMLVPEALRAEGKNARVPVLAFLQRNFELPALKYGERAILTFDDIAGEAAVFINGHCVGQNPYRYRTYTGPEEDFVLDITSYIRTGTNELLIRFYHSGEKLGWELHRGIYGLVYCDIVPEIFCRRILVTPDEDRKGTRVDCILSGKTEIRNSGEIFEWDSGKTVAQFQFSQSEETPYGPMISGSVRVPGAREWSCETPELYGVRIRNASGKVMGVQRFGFRTFRVKNGNLELNGKPVFLRGILPAGFDSKNAVYAFTANPDDIARHYYTQLRKMNVNRLRLNTTTLSRRQYELLDELGLLVQEELCYPTVRLKNSVRADHIDVKSFDAACDRNGCLLPQFREFVVTRLFRRYSHPSVTAFSFGNELRDYSPRVTRMLNNIYELFHKLDKQHRPCMSSSGRYWHLGNNVKELYEKKEKYDLISTHDYTGSSNPLPFTYVENAGKHFDDVVEDVHGADKIPVLNGECVYFVNFYYQQKNFLDPVWRSADAEEPEWKPYLYLMNRWYKNRSNAKLVSYLIRSLGSKNFKYNFSPWRAFHVERILEANRKLWPKRDGFDVLMTSFRSGFFSRPKDFYPFDLVRFGWTPEAEAMRRVCAPIGVFMDDVKGNRFTGSRYCTRITVINNSVFSPRKLNVELKLFHSGVPVRTTVLKCGSLASGQRKDFPFELHFPNEKGICEIRWKIVTDVPVDTPEYVAEFHLESAAELFAPLNCHQKRIAVFDEAEKFGALKTNSTTNLLKRFRVAAEKLGTLSNLEKYDLIVIGSDSVAGKRMQEGAATLRKYIENGGRCLVFEQNFSGRLPFLEELEYHQAGPVLFTEIVQGKHPLIRNLKQKQLFFWNQKDGAVYRSFITPVSECSVTTGGNTAGWGCDMFGMVHAHLKVGRGDVLLIQSETGKLAGKDSAAAKLARNALLMMTDDATRVLARPYLKHAKRKTKAIPSEKTFPVSLKGSANAAFADDIAGDRKGAWNDQGPQNDLRKFPLGMQYFGGTLYRIINPAENNGFGCIAVSGRSGAHQPEESHPVAIGKKLHRIQFLHTAAWEPASGRIGQYTVRYCNGKEVGIPLVIGKNIHGWWGAPGKILSEGECLWSSQGNYSMIGIFGWDWINPEPELEIESVRIKADAPVVIGLFGISGEIAQ